MIFVLKKSIKEFNMKLNHYFCPKNINSKTHCYEEDAARC